MQKQILTLVAIAFLAIMFGCEKQPTANFTASSTEIDEGETVTFTNKSTDADHYKWYFGEGSSSTDENPSFTYTKKGFYNVTLIAFSKSGKQLDDAYLLYINVYQTRLIFNITMGGSPLSNCRVDVYGSSSDWSAKTNKLANTTTGSDGVATFTGCQAKVYYVDFVYNNAIYYSGTTSVLTLHRDNTYDVEIINKKLTFNNATFTPIKITVDGNAQQTIAVGGSLTFSIYNASTIHFTAETYGTYSNGTQMGLKLTWDTSVSTPNETNSLTLNASSTVCFFRITNYSGAHVLNPVYFNYGLSTQTSITASIPADGVLYNLGYHYATSGGQIRAYYYTSPLSYSYWNLSYSYTVNQYKNITNSYKSSEGLDSKAHSTTDLTENLLLLPEITKAKGYSEQPNTLQIESNGVK